jgi:hypothetical protein
MVLADTSVWVDYLRTRRVDALKELLSGDQFRGDTGRRA